MTGPLENYRKRVDSGGLQRDETQENAAEKLQDLYGRLTNP